VCVEPARPQDLPLVERGLALLNQADPCGEVAAAANGELHLSALGELHLQRCVKDLTQRFARCEVRISAPILSFMETIAAPAAPVDAPCAAFPAVAHPQRQASAREGDGGGEGEGAAPAAHAAAQAVAQANPGGGAHSFPYCWLLSDAAVAFHPPSATTAAAASDKQAALRVRALPLPASVTAFLLSNAPALRALGVEERRRGTGRVGAAPGAGTIAGVGDSAGAQLLRFAQQLRSLLAESAPEIAPDFARIVAFSRVGAAVLVCRAEISAPDLELAAAPHDPAAPSLLGSLWGSIGLADELGLAHATPAGEAALPPATASTLRSSLREGFQLASAAGPICGEPVAGVAFVVEGLYAGAAPLAPGPLISAARDAFRVSLEASRTALMEPLFACELACSGGRGGGGEMLGKCFGVLSKRRAVVVSEDLVEGTETFLIKATVPAPEIFGFADELRKQTSGAASAQLLFDRWALLEDAAVAKAYSDSVRERKGLPTDKKVVKDAEKQRTLSRKK
jgi:ribosome assembly protein 1